ncbi:hypothetical protein TNCV_5025081 [Trichonephila clavipes]|nr:hypothetical protein TNCV_5025081 [Trichonephila clavipes]
MVSKDRVKAYEYNKNVSFRNEDGFQDRVKICVSILDEDGLQDKCGRGSLVVKITNLRPAWHELEPSTAQHPPCKEAMHVKSVRAQTSSRWCGVEERRKASSSGVFLVT